MILYSHFVLSFGVVRGKEFELDFRIGRDTRQNGDQFGEGEELAHKGVADWGTWRHDWGFEEQGKNGQNL